MKTPISLHYRINKISNKIRQSIRIATTQGYEDTIHHDSYTHNLKWYYDQIFANICVSSGDICVYANEILDDVIGLTKHYTKYMSE